MLTSKLPIFRSMLGGNMKESSTDKIDVFETDYEPYLAFIEYLYIGEIKKLNSSHLIELLELSDRFWWDHLRSLIEDKLTANLDPATLKYIIEIAQHYNLNTLKWEWKRYIKENTSELLKYGKIPAV